MPYSREQLIILAAVLPVLLASAVAAYRFRALAPALRLLAVLVWWALATEIVSRVFWFYKINNLFLWPIYMSGEFGLLVGLYSLSRRRGALSRAAWLAIIAFGLGAVAEQRWRASQPLLIDNLARLVESVVVIGLALSYAYKLFREAGAGEFWRQSLSWVSAGLLLFFSANFFIYLFINFALNYSQHLNYQIWVAHAALNSLLYLAYAYALWISPAK